MNYLDFNRLRSHKKKSNMSYRVSLVFCTSLQTYLFARTCCWSDQFNLLENNQYLKSVQNTIKHVIIILHTLMLLHTADELFFSIPEYLVASIHLHNWGISNSHLTLCKIPPMISNASPGIICVSHNCLTSCEPRFLHSIQLNSSFSAGL